MKFKYFKCFFFNLYSWFEKSENTYSQGMSELQRSELPMLGVSDCFPSIPNSFGPLFLPIVPPALSVCILFVRCRNISCYICDDNTRHRFHSKISKILLKTVPSVHIIMFNLVYSPLFGKM